MFERKRITALGCLGVLTLAGCRQSASESRTSPTATSAPVSADSPQESSPVRVASAESPTAAESDTLEVESASVKTEDAPATDAPQQAPAQLPPAAAIPLDEAPESQLAMPKVSLSNAHAALCKVKVGDAFPSLPPNDLAGQSAANVMGDKLTVVVFWNGSKPTALEQLGDLGPEIAARFGPRGLKVVAINSGDEPQLAAELAKKAAAQYTSLGDEGGKLLEQTAPARIPSTYLLDASGRVVWFDIEYSRTTRRDLVQAIRFLLAQK